MKARLGFVSNSSSSSFVIQCKYLTDSQLERIINHIEVSREEDLGLDDSRWNTWEIGIYDDHIEGITLMDNFDMEFFLEYIGVDMTKVEWDDDTHRISQRSREWDIAFMHKELALWCKEKKEKDEDS